MAPLAMASPSYDGPKALGFSKYANPAQRTAQLAAASAASISTASASDNTIATKQQIAAMETTFKVMPPAAELAVEQDTALKKQVEDHAIKISRVVSSAVTNTRHLLHLLRESTSSSEVVDSLWQELEQLFETAIRAKEALPEFMEKQRDNMSLYHSSMMNGTIRETQEELNLQHKKVNTQHNLILEQQNAFQHYKEQTTSKLKELESLQERISRLTLEKGNFRTEVDKYKELLDQEVVRQAEDLKTADALQKELEMLASSKKQLHAENETLRKTTTDILEQLKTVEQRVTDRFIKEIQAKAEELQKETVKATSLNTLVNTLKAQESTSRKEFDKLKTESRLLSVKYTSLASEHASAFTKVKDQAREIEALILDVDRLQSQNANLQAKVEKAVELAKVNTGLSQAKEDLIKRLSSLASQLNNAKDDAKAARGEVQMLETKLASKDTAPATSNNNALLEKIKALDEEKHSVEAALAEWTDLAKRSYKEYKDTRKVVENLQQDARGKEIQITDLEHQLAAATASQSNGVGVVGGDAAYWKQKYEMLLSTID